MSSFTDLMRSRHTVRSYAQTPVELEKLRAVLEAGQWAPTAVNAQPQRIVVLDTPETLAHVQEFCTFGWSKRYAKLAHECDTPDHEHNVFYYGAPVVLLICYDRTACWSHPQTHQLSGPTDATIVATHMMLEATAQGLGSAWISFFDSALARKLLSIPSKWEICSMLYLGYPAADERPAHISGTRKPLSQTCFHNHVPLPGEVTPS
ncbi:MAG: nitroreductase family protein [Coriobacteriales bacterium]|nr:nitroreductase family protein [Coriobacteriales bacterium]